MCVWHPLTVRAVTQEIWRRVGQGDIFTAYDVSRTVRAEGVEARHGDIRRLVHALFENGHMGDEYVRTLGSVGEGQTAFLYHRPEDAPDLYAEGVRTVARLLEPQT
jgi:hypothetical protein